jgi:hypothetical protein
MQQVEPMPSPVGVLGGNNKDFVTLANARVTLNQIIWDL